MRYVTLRAITPAQRESMIRLVDPAVVEGPLAWGRLYDERIFEELSPGLLLHSITDDEELPATFHHYRALVLTAGVRLTVSKDREPIESPASSVRQVLVVNLLGPLFRQWLETLSSRGATVVEHLGRDTYVVATEGDDNLNDLDFVGGVRPYLPEDAIRLVDPPAELSWAEPLVTIEVLLHAFADAGRLTSWLDDNGAQVIESDARFIRYVARRDSSLTIALAEHDDVALVDEARPAGPANDRARAIVGLGGVGPTYQGAGQIVAVADTGVDDQHPDLASQLAVSPVDLGGRGTTADTSGHGTHVAASIVGAGISGPFQGIAPNARLQFQSITGTNGQLLGPTLIDQILANAVNNGARIVNLSWTELPGEGHYSATAWKIDRFARDNPTVLVVAAAGNLGAEAFQGYGQQGDVAIRTVAPPSTAKSCLSVGASRSDVTGITTALQPQDWSTWFPGRFVNNPVASDALSGNAESLDARSGRGPCASDPRLKPDVVAPGTFICSARANVGAAGEFWALGGLPDYAYNGGSSMATAVVSGCAAIVRDWLVHAAGCDPDREPSAALIRGLLLNGTTWLTGWDAVQGGCERPNYHQGFGRVDLSASLPSPNRPDWRVVFLDDWDNVDQLELATLGEEVVWRFGAEAGDKLRLCLTWNDPPAESVKNRLGIILTLEDSDAEGPPLAEWRGNEMSPGRLRSPNEEDTWNCVQAIVVDTPDAGAYCARVHSNTTIIEDPQRFALVLSGRVTWTDDPVKRRTI